MYVMTRKLMFWGPHIVQNVPLCKSYYIVFKREGIVSTISRLI